MSMATLHPHSARERHSKWPWGSRNNSGFVSWGRRQPAGAGWPPHWPLTAICRSVGPRGVGFLALSFNKARPKWAKMVSWCLSSRNPRSEEKPWQVQRTLQQRDLNTIGIRETQTLATTNWQDFTSLYELYVCLPTPAALWPYPSRSTTTSALELQIADRAASPHGLNTRTYWGTRPSKLPCGRAIAVVDGLFMSL